MESRNAVGSARGWRAGLLLVSTLAVAPVIAGDKGHYRGHAVLLNMKFSEQKTSDGHPYKALWQGEQEGLIFSNSTDSPFDKLLDKAHYLVQFVGDAGTASGYCTKTFTTKEGDKLFGRCDWKGSDQGSSGSVTLLGGTGKFAGVKGSGKFSFHTVTPVVNWDDIEWHWEIP
jgi:hypothetical protein